MTLSSNEIEVATEHIAGTLIAPGASTKEIEGRSLGQLAWRTLKRDKLAMAGGVWALILILVAIFADQIVAAYGQNPNTEYTIQLDLTIEMPIGGMGGISGRHWLGVTPVNGQDIFAQLVYGARTSLEVAGGAAFLALLFGVTLGVIAGFFRGFLDTVISRIMDLLLSFPILLFSIALLSVANTIPALEGFLGRFLIISFVLGFFSFPYIGRIVRGQVLSLREKEFVDAARSLGASNWRIMSREIAPSLVGPILVYTTLTIPNFIIGEASLSFLGVGFQPPTVSWGSMLSDAGNYFQIDPEYLFAPGIALFLAVLAFNLFGDGLRDALDPRSRR
jgi:ABC-type dipeptide/oligopeptide/nickel transport system permease subunit